MNGVTTEFHKDKYVSCEVGGLMNSFIVVFCTIVKLVGICWIFIYNLYGLKAVPPHSCQKLLTPISTSISVSRVKL